MDPKNMTEYKRSFVWSKPMVETPPPKPEPLISNYQISYGLHAAPPAVARTLSSSDHVDHSSNESRSPTPGYAIKEPLRADVPEVANHVTRQPIPTGPNPAEQLGNGPSVLFSYEAPPRPPSPLDPIKQSEYHDKFKPFDDYVYVEGEGKFKKQTAATKLVAASVPLHGAPAGVPPPTSATKAWFVEVEERCKQACKYRARSQNGATPINPEHPWDGVTVKDRNLQALALATKLIVEEKKQERKTRSASAKPTSRSSHARLQLSSAPSSLRDQSSLDSASSAKPKAVPRKPAPGKASLVVMTTDKNNNVGPAKPPIVPKKAAPLGAQPKDVAANKAPEAKVWIKPKKKEPVTGKPPTGQQPEKSDSPKPVAKPASKAAAAAATPPAEQKKEPKVANVAEPQPEVKQFDPEPKSVPLRTTDVKSPEELTGIKSPSPESWKVSIEKGGLNWVNGNTPVNFDGSKTTASAGLVKPVPINVLNDDMYGPLSA